MEAGMQKAVEQIVAQQEQWIKSLAEQAEQLEGPADVAAFERQLREQGLKRLRQMQQQLLQARMDAKAETGRVCPHCQARRRHKGRRARSVVGLLGALTLEGVQWHCDCGTGSGHAIRDLYKHTISPPLRELVCLLGIDGSFCEAQRRCRKLLGVTLSAKTIRRVTEAAGREAAAAEPEPCERPVCGQLIGSCDGTMVNIREDGWRELRAYRFDDDRGRRLSGATLERSRAFVPRLRKLALSQHADRVKRFIFVSDAAEWIAQAVDEFLPEASDHVIDIYHAYQHIHEAARAIHGEGTEAAKQWARRWCDRLKHLGGRRTWDRLRRARFAQPHQQQALAKLLGYLARHADRMDYPRCQAQGIPISSGPIESTCKQLGRRLKGSGMRWSRHNVTPLAALVSLWHDHRWDTHWQTAA